MSERPEVHLGIIGLGVMGNMHAQNALQRKVTGLRLTAVADSNPEALKQFGEDVLKFNDATAMMDSGAIDAVLIATPHFSHPLLGIAALERGLHVLTEKPIAVHKADAERLAAAWTNHKLIFGAVFNQRCNPVYSKLKQLIDTGELGAIQRINWIITDWYRTDAYYRSGNWRATWRGEGGGVLLNQCPHNLDLWQWLFGMPSKITAHCQFGRFHPIEVEDAVTAMLDYPGGATGVFITSTGEAPGVNRLEVAADRGHVVIENGQMTFQRTEHSVAGHTRTCAQSFTKPDCWEIKIPAAELTNGHIEILQNFADAILDGKPLIAPATEGVFSVELANAMLHSAFTAAPVILPLDSAAYQTELESRF